MQIELSDVQLNQTNVNNDTNLAFVHGAGEPDDELTKHIKAEISALHVNIQPSQQLWTNQPSH